LVPSFDFTSDSKAQTSSVTIRNQLVSQARRMFEKIQVRSPKRPARDLIFRRHSDFSECDYTSSRHSDYSLVKEHYCSNRNYRLTTDRFVHCVASISRSRVADTIVAFAAVNTTLENSFRLDVVRSTPASARLSETSACVLISRLNRFSPGDEPTARTHPCWTERLFRRNDHPPRPATAAIAASC
jgi:hypothetical protein